MDMTYQQTFSSYIYSSPEFSSSHYHGPRTPSLTPTYPDHLSLTSANTPSPTSMEQKIAEMQDPSRRTPQQVIRANSDLRRKQALMEIEEILKSQYQDVPYGTPKQLAAFLDLYKVMRTENERLKDENAILRANLLRFGYRI